MEESNRVPSIEPSRKFMHAIVAGLRIGPNASLVALVSHNDRYDPVGWPLTKRRLSCGSQSRLLNVSQPCSRAD
ncbi:hypothetical protein DPMN_005607 [Dreissena polymorpha]|uniref:Uncharacterized protein n=1 Tax=Dreissena polymorpha TaxID=45954 RepID=A0A9D4MT23_DREPO|nr:hypothetical protein DPMN_005607 [Dreissena polymorpha]